MKNLKNQLKKKLKKMMILKLKKKKMKKKRNLKQRQLEKKFGNGNLLMIQKLFGLDQRKKSLKMNTNNSINPSLKIMKIHHHGFIS
jgi:hypothetical protein